MQIAMRAANASQYRDVAVLRLALGLPIAAVITAALAAVMAHLVQVDEVSVERSEPRILKPIVYQEPEPEPIRHTHKSPQKISAISPPPMQKVQGSATSVSIPLPVLPAVETKLEATSIKFAPLSPSGFMDRPLEAIRPPLAVYPEPAAVRGLEGSCEVRFSLSPRGTPFNVDAICTDRVFVKAAVRAVERAEFLPQVRSGQPSEVHNLIYPLVFKLDN